MLVSKARAPSSMIGPPDHTLLPFHDHDHDLRFLVCFPSVDVFAVTHGHLPLWSLKMACLALPCPCLILYELSALLPCFYLYLVDSRSFPS